MEGLISSECSPEILVSTISYILGKYGSLFEKELFPEKREKQEYIGDILQFICASGV